MCHISHWSRICDTQGLTILGKTHHCVCYWRCLVPSWCVLQCQWGLLLSPVFSSCSLLVDTDVTLILVMSQGTTTTEAGRDSSDQTRQHTTLDLRLAQHWLVDWTLNTIHYACMKKSFESDLYLGKTSNKEKTTLFLTNYFLTSSN